MARSVNITPEVQNMAKHMKTYKFPAPPEYHTKCKELSKLAEEKRLLAFYEHGTKVHPSMGTKHSPSLSDQTSPGAKIL